MTDDPRQTDTTADLPTVPQRQIGEAWLRLYGHMVADDPAFCAAAVYRCMMLARSNPNAPELAHLWKEARP